MDAAVAQREQGGHVVLVRDAVGGGRLHHRAVHVFDGSALGECALRIGVRSFDMLVWLVVLAVGRQNLFGFVATFALVRFMSAVGTDVGAIAGHTTNDIVGTNDDAAMLIAEVVLFAFVAFLWLGFRKFSFADTIRAW